MRTSILLILLSLVFSFSGPLSAEEPATAPVEKETELVSLVADHITDTTMVAISPLVVVSAQAAWEYLQADPGARDSLPWYTTPWLWGSLMALGLLFMSNATLGNVVPFLKTPMNVVENYESKITAFLIGLPVILTRVYPSLKMPSSVDRFTEAGEAAGNSEILMAGLALPTSPVGIAGMVIVLVPALIAIFVLVWLTFDVVHVLCLISPFGQVDFLLKLARLALIGAIFLTATISPVLGLILCLALIVLCYFVAGWSFRLMVYGTVLSWDLIRFRHRDFSPEEEAMKAFLAREVSDAPIRSYGVLERKENGTVSFGYRPWLFLPRRTVELPAETHLAVQKGLLSPVVLAGGSDGESGLFRLPPRFRGHEEAVAASLSAEGAVRDFTFKRGWSAARSWISQLWAEGRREFEMARA
ncbi:MAG: hypothetical protein AAF514_20595 [Verrucomicrobiota bacterium]